MNMTEKLATKIRLGARTLRQLTSSSSATETPVTADRYPGTRGRTHGERNDTMPAPSAAKRPIPAAGSPCIQPKRSAAPATPPKRELSERRGRARGVFASRGVVGAELGEDRAHAPPQQVEPIGVL